ncbi:MAG: glycogen debranching protein [Bacteroidetes bacterium]|nr:MAG: glycogen debranching protein [Bacteroidota bacterium]
MFTTIGTNVLSRYDRASTYEWLETNGLGGYASSTIIGAHTRRYHGLLVAAMKPPVERTILLSKLDETLHIAGKSYELGTNKYQGAIFPNGYIFLKTFYRGLFPEFTYQAGGVTLRKTIVGVHGENTTLVTYEVLEAPHGFTLDLLPLYGPRDFHGLGHANGLLNPHVSFEDGHFHTQAYPDQPSLYLSVPGAQFTHAPNWYFNFEYEAELYRGLEAHEDLFSPGHFSLQLEAGQRVGIIVSADPTAGRDAWALFEIEKNRRLGLIAGLEGKSDVQKGLTLAADQFIVKRDQDLRSIIAGYHWFSDWGRDTMIALPGLCLATGRHDDARRILAAFASSVSDGMLPNRFPDHGEAPLYNNIDATLWFFVAAYKYLRATGDRDFVLQTLLPVFRDILQWHEVGTRYQIRMDEDGLLAGGEEGVQLTWMDAMVGDWVVTPRRGKAVEVNALWYNAWKIYAWLHRLADRETEFLALTVKAEQIKDQFLKTFWNEADGCLYDVVDGEYRDAAIRPNQLFAISLPFPLLDTEQANQVLFHIEDKLFTPRGLRSLAPDDPSYQPVYGGNQFQRDGAYHQGTVWSWLMGAYVDALIYVKGNWGRRLATNLLRDFEVHFSEAGIGSVSEIFDAQKPYQARGCIAQAWGVGELLRIGVEYGLFSQPAAETEPTKAKVLDLHLARRQEQVQATQATGHGAHYRAISPYRMPE